MTDKIVCEFVVKQFTWDEIEAVAPLAAFIRDAVDEPWVGRFVDIIEFMMSIARTQDIVGAPEDVEPYRRPADGKVAVGIVPIMEDGMILDRALDVFELLKTGAPSRAFADRQRELIVGLFDWYRSTARAIQAQAADGGISSVDLRV